MHTNRSKQRKLSMHRYIYRQIILLGLSIFLTLPGCSNHATPLDSAGSEGVGVFGPLAQSEATSGTGPKPASAFFEMNREELECLRKEVDLALSMPLDRATILFTGVEFCMELK